VKGEKNPFEIERDAGRGGGGGRGNTQNNQTLGGPDFTEGTGKRGGKTEREIKVWVQGGGENRPGVRGERGIRRMDLLNLHREESKRGGITKVVD